MKLLFASILVVVTALHTLFVLEIPLKVKAEA